MEKEKSCGAVIFRKMNNQLQFLVIQQRHGLHFGFPKGHVEVNESEIDTAKREVREETGLEVNVFPEKRIATHYYPRPGVFKEVIYFLAEALTSSVIIQKEEIADYHWINQVDVMKHLTYDNDKRVFSSLLKKLLQNGEIHE